LFIFHENNDDDVDHFSSIEKITSFLLQTNLQFSILT
jgi:hypothetical protein